MPMQRDFSSSAVFSANSFLRKMKKEYTLNVSGLTKNVNENHLREIFGIYGKVNDIHLPIDKNYSIPSGYAYVEFSKLEEAQEAIESLNCGQIDGREIKVEFFLTAQKQHDERKEKKNNYYNERKYIKRKEKKKYSLSSSFVSSSSSSFSSSSSSSVSSSSSRRSSSSLYKNKKAKIVNHTNEYEKDKISQGKVAFVPPTRKILRTFSPSLSPKRKKHFLNGKDYDEKNDKRIFDTNQFKEEKEEKKSI